MQGGAKGEVGDKGPTGDPGLPGENGEDGNGWFSGEGEPLDSLGNDGDYYFDTINNNVYFKEDGEWKLITNLKGDDGADGNKGEDGKPGSDGSNGTNGKDAYSNTILPSYHGMVSVDKGSAYINESLTFLIDPDEGYEVETFSLNGNKIPLENLIAVENSNNFIYNTTMVENGYVVSATFKEEIKVDSISLSVESTNLYIGDVTTLKASISPRPTEDIQVNYEILEGEGVISITNNVITALSEGTARIVASFKGVKSNELTITVSEFSALSLKEVYTKKAGESVELVAKYVGSYNEGTQSFGEFLGDGDYGLFVYKAVFDESIQPGDLVYVKGTVDIFRGGFQVKDASFNKFNGTFNVEEPRLLDLTNNDLSEVNGYDTGRKVKASGVVSNYSTGQNYIEFNLGESNILVRIDTRYCSNETISSFESLKNGDEITVTGYAGYYVSNSAALPNDSKGFQIVNPKIDESNKFNISIDTTSLKVGESVTIGNDIVDFDQTKITYTLSDTNVLSIDGNKLTALKTGSCEVSASYEGGLTSNTITITVTDDSGIPQARKVTIEELINYDYSYYQQENPQSVFEVTGIVTEWYQPSSGGPSDFGNFYLADENNLSKSIIVYGATVTKDKLTFNTETGKWSFANPRDFSITNGCNIGDRVTLKVLLDEYNGNNQIKGEILKTEKVTINSISLSSTASSVAIGGTTELIVTSDPSYGNLDDLIFEVTSGSDYVSISNNVLTGVSAGKAKVVAKLGDLTSNEIEIEVTGETLTKSFEFVTNSVTWNPNSNSYVNREATLTEGKMYVTVGSIQTGNNPANGYLTFGTNSGDKYPGLVPYQILNAIGVMASQDTNTDGNTYYASIYMDFDIDCKKFEINFIDHWDSETADLKIVYSIDGGSTYVYDESICSISSDKLKRSIEFEELKKARFALVLTKTKSTIRVPIESFVAYK